ncbi:nucleotidyltransferase [Paenibacillus xerothermodurans]|uniref:tRNA(Met) cytidine acetate ligase n=1 Tax=Paenibacillus xerothermodurans TaxID=1977292 RepID=A0A2W1NXS9_PAEXE|nr:nucleotidyltransferase [Paenibacillus xerothermodurans]PZE22496.1 nucleotidyltransferase [Paenibacillus xerothermodurans]
MKTVGLIVEYNPLHNGHYYHFQQSKKSCEADAAIAVMSGHFLQRGEPAVAGKWARAEMALRMGVDLVIELPVAYSAQPAEWFAFGAVSALAATGVVDTLCFGSEIGDIGWLQAVADAMHQETEAFQSLLQQQLKAGVPYPAAYGSAVARYVKGTDPAELAQPNNTLGLHYLIALRRLRSPIQPVSVARQKAGYNQVDITDNAIASATAVRRIMFEQGALAEIAPYVPEATMAILAREQAAGRSPISWDRYTKPLLLQLLHHGSAELAAFHEVSEGLEHRIKQAVSGLSLGGEHVINDLIDLLKTKRYTRTKLQRMLLRILLNHTKEQLRPAVLAEGVPYLRVLGFSDKGRALLKRMKTAAKVPIVTKVTSMTGTCPLLQMDIQATSVYALGFEAASERELFRDYYEPPIRL